jgi:tripartite-type tricarboxylate transporter receptor subunit TctC
MSSLVLGSFFYPNNAPPLTALTPLGAFAFSPFVLVSSKFNSISEMTNKQIKFGNPSMGSLPHVLSVLMGKVAGFQAIPLPAKGSGPMIQEILNGQSDVAFAPIAAAKSLVASGRLRYLAATAKIDEIPEIPTFDQLGLGDAVINEWYGLFAPAGISLSLVSQLNKSLNMAVESKEQQQIFSNFGIVPQFSSPEQFSQLLTLYSLRLGKVINEESIKLEI